MLETLAEVGALRERGEFPKLTEQKWKIITKSVGEVGLW